MDTQTLRAEIAARLEAPHPLSPSPQELRRRREAVATELRRRGASMFVGFAFGTIKYLTRYPAVDTERPVSVLIDDTGKAAIFVSRLRAADAGHQSVDCDIVEYPEFPGRR